MGAGGQAQTVRGAVDGGEVLVDEDDVDGAGVKVQDEETLESQEEEVEPAKIVPTPIYAHTVRDG